MKNTKKSKYYKSKKINNNKKMTTQKKNKRSKKKNNKAGVLTLIEQDQLLALIRYTYFQNQNISPIIEKISLIFYYIRLIIKKHIFPLNNII